MSKQKKFIDVEGLIQSKNPKALKWLPKFILAYLKRIIHEKDINSFLERNKNKYDADF